MSLPDRHDDTIMNALVAKLEEMGIHVMDQTLFLKHIMPEEGVLSRRKPTDKEWEDMKYGFRMAKKIGGLDIGQTVVVKDMAIMAVEAIEGTDACSSAAAPGQGAIVAKTAKPAQDHRFDVPGVGVKTMESMIESAVPGTVMETGRTLFVEREQALALANEHNLVVVSMSEETAGR